MARRKFKRAGFNTKLIIDVGLAGIATRILPMVVNKFMPLDPTLYSVVGAGGTYVVGSMLKKPDLANAGIALGLVELVAPMVENLIGGVITSPVLLPSAPTKTNPSMVGRAVVETSPLSDYGRLSGFDSSTYGLNDYISTPGVRQNVQQYGSSY